MIDTTYSTRVRAPAPRNPPSSAFDDAATLNPSGRVVADVAIGGLPPLLRPKKVSRFSTLNVRTLKGLKINELISLAEETNQEVVCIQEHRFIHPNNEIKYDYHPKGWLFVSSSAWTSSNNCSIGGVGFLFSPRASKSINSITSPNPRIITAKLEGNPATTIIGVYSPTNCSADKDAEDFYHLLTDTIKAVPKHHLMMIGGDFNAQTGPTTTIPSSSYHSTPNRNGTLLMDLLVECNLIALNTCFRKRKGKLWTIEYANGAKGQIDYILLNKKWKNSALDCEAYNTSSNLNTDHRIVSAKVRLSLRANKPRKRTNIYNWSSLLSDSEVQSNYLVEVQNRFDCLSSEVNIDTNTQRYDLMIKAHRTATEKCVPKRPRIRRKVPWEDDTVIGKRENLREMAKKKRNDRSTANIDNFNRAVTELNEAYENGMKRYVEKSVKKIKDASYHARNSEVWRICNEVTQRKKTSKGILKADSPAERLTLWKEHFEKLLAPPAATQAGAPFRAKQIVNRELPICTDNFTMQELDNCLRQLSNNKAAGLDEIPGEVWKIGALKEELLKVCNDAFSGDKPDVWGLNGIIPVPKKGDLSNPQNYRGISLSSIAAKVYNKLILQRVRPHIDPLLRKNQNGFREGRSTVSQILALRRIIEGIKSKNLTAVLTFVDFKKAFDSVDRAKLIIILASYGIPQKLIDAIAVMYANTRAKVLSSDGETTIFNITAGVLQGDTLAPFLFIIIVDYVMRSTLEDHNHLGFTLNKTTRRNQPLPQNTFTDTDYADDLCLISDSVTDAQSFLTRLENAAAEFGLVVNVEKTEAMMFNTVGTLTTITGEPIENKQDFKYLGAWISSTSKEFNVRKGCAWSALNKLDKLWKSSLPRHLKIEFFKATVESVLLYGAESWTLTKTLEKSLNGCYTRLLRHALNIKWQQRMTNKELYKDLPPISEVVRTRRLKFAGHCYRADECAADVLFWDPKHGKRGRGRPAITYIDNLVEDTGLQVPEIRSTMSNRELWRDICHDTSRRRSTR